MVAEWPFSASSKTAEAGKREFAELGGLLSYGSIPKEPLVREDEVIQ
jgi:hypothetical protein